MDMILNDSLDDLLGDFGVSPEFKDLAAKMQGRRVMPERVAESLERLYSEPCQAL